MSDKEFNPFTAPVPQDANAERAVIGAVLVAPTALDKARKILTAEDFYRPAHETIWNAIITIAGEGRPVDAITILERLRKDRDLTRAGGGSYISDLYAAAPVTETVTEHARIVRELSTRRRVIREAQRLIQRASNGESEVGTLAADAVTALTGVRDRDNHDVPVTFVGDLLDEDEVYDWLVPDLLERRDRVIVTAEEGSGKALALDTPIPTPSGWATMGDLSVGDVVLGADGKPTKVTFATPVMYDRHCFRVEFSDGESIVADAEHQWLTEGYWSRIRTAQQARRTEMKPRGTDQRSKRMHFPSVVTTQEIAETLYARGGHTLNHTIDAAAPLDLPDADIPISPYTLGAWLGDGHSAGGRITIGDVDREEMRANLAADGWPTNEQSGKYLYGIRGLQQELRALGVLGNKHIPATYLRGSFDQRLALLQGLMDTDGTVASLGTGFGRSRGAAPCEFSVTRERLARDVHELVTSLGIIARISEGDAKIDGRVVGRRWRVAFQTDLPVFRLRRKAERITPLRTARTRHRFITAVTPVDPVPVRCIQVDNANHLYLAGRGMVPTHNTTLLRQFAICLAAGIHPLTLMPLDEVHQVLFVDAENSRPMWRRKIRPMVIQAAKMASDPRNRIAIDLPGRIDITSDRDLSRLHALADKVEAEVMCIGPLYRLVPRAVQTDDEAAPLLAALDTFRDRGITLLIEAHAGHGMGRNGNRDLRPRGSSALLGWPEFGIALRPDIDDSSVVKLEHWRGERDEREWPNFLLKYGQMPFEAKPDCYDTSSPYARRTA